MADIGDRHALPLRSQLATSSGCDLKRILSCNQALCQCSSTEESPENRCEQFGVSELFIVGSFIQYVLPTELCDLILAPRNEFQLDITYSSFCLVFIDGEFWGHYEITEKLIDDFIRDHFGIQKKNVVLMKNEEVEEGAEEDGQAFAEFRKKFANTYEDLTTAEFEDNQVRDAVMELYGRNVDIILATYDRFWPAWPGGQDGVNILISQVQDILNFFAERRQYSDEHVMKMLSWYR